MVEASESDLALINAKIEELAVVYPQAEVDYGYDELHDSVMFRARVLNIPGGMQEISSTDATDVESFLAGIIADLE
jgi:hypothetical protein